MIRFSCETCKRSLRAPLDMAGKKGRCARCGAVNAVPVPPVAAQTAAITTSPVSVAVRRAPAPSPFRNTADIALTDSPPRFVRAGNVGPTPWSAAKVDADGNVLGPPVTGMDDEPAGPNLLNIDLATDDAEAEAFLNQLGTLGHSASHGRAHSPASGVSVRVALLVGIVVGFILGLLFARTILM